MRDFITRKNEIIRCSGTRRGQPDEAGITEILPQILLVIVGAGALSCTEITELSRRGHAVGRLSVDVDVDPQVDLIGN